MQLVTLTIKCTDKTADDLLDAFVGGEFVSLGTGGESADFPIEMMQAVDA